MKTHAWLLTVSFVPFSIFGFLFAQFSTHEIKQPNPPTSPISIPEVQRQTNVLFISVDTDTKPYPRLVSVWGLFFSTMDQNAAEIIPLYPSKDPLEDTVLLSEFFLTQDEHLDQDFLDLTQKAFQVKWDNYIVISQKEISEISKHLETDRKISDSNSLSAGSDRILLQQFCSLLKTGQTGIDLRNILDTQNLDHNMTTSTLILLDQWIETGKPFSSCEVQQ